MGRLHPFGKLKEILLVLIRRTTAEDVQLRPIRMDPRRWHVTTAMDCMPASGASVGNLSGDIHLGEAHLGFAEVAVDSVRGWLRYCCAFNKPASGGAFATVGRILGALCIT